MGPNAPEHVGKTQGNLGMFYDPILVSTSEDDLMVIECYTCKMADL